MTELRNHPRHEDTWVPTLLTKRLLTHTQAAHCRAFFVSCTGACQKIEDKDRETLMDVNRLKTDKGSSVNDKRKREGRSQLRLSTDWREDGLGMAI